MSDDFVSVKQNSAVWEPKQTGSKKEGNLVALEPSEKSYLTGYYLETRVIQVQGNTSTMHDFQLDGAGSKKSLPEGVNKEDKISIWGTGVLNDLISENVNPGEYVMVKWTGIKASKKVGGNSYHTWDVLKNPKVEPLDLGGHVAVPEKNVPSGEPVQGAEIQEDDDLPF